MLKWGDFLALILIIYVIGDFMIFLLIHLPQKIAELSKNSFS
jgi:hypothetical protein